MLAGAGGCRCPCEDGQNHIAARDAGRERFGAGGFDSIQPMVEHRAQDFDELAITVGMLLQLRGTWAKAVGRSQSLNGAPLRKRQASSPGR